MMKKRQKRTWEQRSCRSVRTCYEAASGPLPLVRGPLPLPSCIALMAAPAPEALCTLCQQHPLLLRLFLTLTPYGDVNGFRDAQRDTYVALRTTCKALRGSLFAPGDLDGFLDELARRRRYGLQRVTVHAVREKLKRQPTASKSFFCSSHFTSMRSLQTNLNCGAVDSQFCQRSPPSVQEG